MDMTTASETKGMAPDGLAAQIAVLDGRGRIRTRPNLSVTPADIARFLDLLGVCLN